MRNMKTVTVKPNQTVFDILVGQYGTCEALAEFLEIIRIWKMTPGQTNGPYRKRNGFSGSTFP